MARQMTIDERKRIDFLLQLRWTPVQIAKEMGRSKTTIIREIVNRSVSCDRGHRCSNRICALFDRCPRVKGYGRDAKRSFNCTPRCFEVCPDFVERTCEWSVKGSDFFDTVALIQPMGSWCHGIVTVNEAGELV